MECIIHKEKVNTLLTLLMKNQLYAPVKDEEGIVNFKLVSSPAEVTLDYSNSKIPPKGLLQPQTDTMFKFKTKEGSVELEQVERKGHRVILGVRPCDARSLNMLDAVFGGEYCDPYYRDTRENTLIIGLACNVPAYNCFCTSVDGDLASKEALDILLTDIGEKYYVEALTQKGEKLVKDYAELFIQPSERDRTLKNKVHTQSRSLLKRKLDTKGIPSKMKDVFEHPFWDEASRSCLGCGVCTFLCPTCYCFDVNDEAFSGNGARVRTWDACMFPSYTMHASGHNPRPSRKSRLRNRVYHKFQYHPENYRVLGCVGCGRCINSCPVNIDLIVLLSEIQKLRPHKT